MMQLQKKKKERFFIGIRGKLSICFILLLLIVMAFIDVAVYQIYQGDIEQKEIASMTDSGAILSDNIHNLLGNLEEDLMYDIQRSRLFGYLTDDWELSAPNAERKMHTLGTLLHFRGLECTDIFILDRNDSTFFCNYLKNGSTFADFEKKEIYHRILETQEALFPAKGCTIWRSCEDSPDELYMIKSYIDPVSLDYYGIVCITISNADFKELLGEYNFDIALYDEQQSFLFCSSKSATRSQLEDQKNYLSVSTPIRRNRGDWSMVSYISRAVAFRDLDALMPMLFLTEVLLGIVVIFIVYRITKGFLWNITALTENFKRIHNQEIPQKIEPHSHDETTYLCEQFETMYHQLQENAKQMILTNTLLNKAEYSALLAQMNPHFLYNSLESISAMARLREQEEIVNAIRLLSQLLRGSLSSGVQEIPLSGEIEYVSCYLEMQRIITGDRLTWDIDVDDSLQGAPVPRLILQPIVENAILHGLDEMLQDAVVIITADVRDKQLVLTVSDNGKGADQAMLDALLSSEEEIENPKERRAHIGIQSVLKRIHILYGTDYGMTMESEPGSGMTVRIYLPYDKKKNTDRG